MPNSYSWPVIAVKTGKQFLYYKNKPREQPAAAKMPGKKPCHDKMPFKKPCQTHCAHL